MTEPDDVHLLFSAIARDSRRFLSLLLSEPSVDINCRYFGETPLQCAIRWRHSDLAVFLLERGADPGAKKVLLEATEGNSALSWFEVDCRQLAYDAEMVDVVRAIDYLRGELFPFLPTPSCRPGKCEDNEGMFSDVVEIPEDFFEPSAHRSGGRYATLPTSRRTGRRRPKEAKEKREPVRFEYDRVLSTISRSRPRGSTRDSLRPQRTTSSYSLSSSRCSSSSSVFRETKSSLLRKSSLAAPRREEKEERWRRRRRIGLRDALFGACLEP